MDRSRLKIVFEKVAEATASSDLAGAEVPLFSPAELDEIGELRRLCVELAEPELESCASTRKTSAVVS